jgi:hypothetical protein
MTAVIALRDGPWTLARLTDELFYRLAVFEHYYEQANRLMHRIPLYEPVPSFVISLTDLSQRLRSELEECKKSTRGLVLIGAVGKLFENIDYNYFHYSVKSRLVVELR